METSLDETSQNATVLPASSLSPVVDELETFLEMYVVSETHDIGAVVEAISSSSHTIKPNKLSEIIDGHAKALSEQGRFKGQYTPASQEIQGDLLYTILLGISTLKDWRDKIGFKFANLDEWSQKWIAGKYTSPGRYVFEFAGFFDVPLLTLNLFFNRFEDAVKTSKIHSDCHLEKDPILGAYISLDALGQYLNIVTNSKNSRAAQNIMQIINSDGISDSSEVCERPALSYDHDYYGSISGPVHMNPDTLGPSRGYAEKGYIFVDIRPDKKPQH